MNSVLKIVEALVILYKTKLIIHFAPPWKKESILPLNVAMFSLGPIMLITNTSSSLFAEAEIREEQYSLSNQN